MRYNDARVARWILFALLTAAALLVLGVLVYAVVSFVRMRVYSPGPLRPMLRALARETYLAILTQPFLPLYYFAGQRMDHRRSRLAGNHRSAVPVVFVHGYMQNRVCFLGMARHLEQRGIGPLYGFNYPWFDTVEANAERLERFIRFVCRQTQSPAVDLVCHSLGGLVALQTLRTEARASDANVRRCVTVATPHAGVLWEGPLLGVGAAILRKGSKFLQGQAGYVLEVPTLSIFSDTDNIVYPTTTSSLRTRGGRDLEVEGLGHLSILFDAHVADAVADFLLESLEPAAANVVAPTPEQAAAAHVDQTQVPDADPRVE